MMKIGFFENSQEVIHFVCQMVAIATVITALQSFLTLKNTYRPNKILNWDVVKSHLRYSHYVISTKVLSSVLRYPNIFLVFAIRFSGGVLLLIMPYDWSGHFVNLVLIFLSFSLIQYRDRLTFNGGDSMLVSIIGALCLLYISPADQYVQQSFLCFITFQLIFAYTVMGYHKFKDPEWRKGEALVRLFKDPGYVSTKFAHMGWLYPRLLGYSGHLVIVWQLSFPLVLFLNEPYAYLYLLVGVGFHFFNGVFLGLNIFLLSWVACYPALIYCHQWLHQMLPY